MFDRVVNLYRLLGKPSLDEAHSFIVTVPKDQELLAELDAASSMDSSFGTFSYREKGTELRVEGELPQNSDAHFFISVEDFVERTPSLNKGVFRENFYVRDKDFSSTEGVDSCEEISNIARIVDFIKALRDFAAITLDDDQTLESGKLIFLKAADDNSTRQAAVLRVNIHPSLASVKIKKYQILNEIKSAKNRSRPHIEERILLMNSAISEVISECVDDDRDFEYLVKNWDRVTRKYFHNLHAYMNGFSFDAIRKKISDSVIDSTTKINNAVSELGTKILGVPIALGALIALYESEKVGYAFWLGILGVLSAASIIHRTIIHYEAQLVNLIKTFNFNFEVSLTARRAFSKSILNELDRVESELLNQRKRVEKTIAYYKFFSLLPYLFCAILIFYKNLYLVINYWEFLICSMTFLMLFFCSKENS